MCLQLFNIHRNNDSSMQRILTSSITHLKICSNLLIESSNQLPFFNREEAQLPSGRYHGPIKDELRWNVHNDHLHQSTCSLTPKKRDCILHNQGTAAVLFNNSGSVWHIERLISVIYRNYYSLANMSNRMLVLCLVLILVSVATCASISLPDLDCDFWKGTKCSVSCLFEGKTRTICKLGVCVCVGD
ncbi:hypothetical protein Ddc_00387 [Ditylenchus destructor]|nr:hypothetical protein Ddc_00387 [Ditylenchus destructor]